MIELNKKDNIPIFLSADNNYAPFIATTIASVCYNTKSFIDFYVLDSGITNDNKLKIQNLKNKFNNFSIEFISIDTEKCFSDIEYKNYGQYISISTYNRFLIPYIKPQLNKVIYLDVDIIVNLDIAELYNIDLGNYSIGAVKEYWRKNEPFLQRHNKIINLSDKDSYFNAGVLLINLQSWKNSNLLAEVFNIEKKYRDRLQFADQDILNIYYDNNYKQLPHKFNVLNCFDKNIHKLDMICHFAGKVKPWIISENVAENKYLHFLKNKNLFWEYAQMTPFYEDLLDNTKIKNDNELIDKYSDEIIKSYLEIFNSFLDNSLPEYDEKFQKLKNDVLTFNNMLKNSDMYISDFQKYIIKNLINSASLDEYRIKLGSQPWYRYQTRDRIQRKTVVSVIIPVYNTEKYLTKCLKSVLNQTFENIEVICVNDASVDGSLDILQEFSQNDNRVHIIDLKINQGISNARNAGINIAKGEYIYFIDSDDWIDKNYLEEMVDKIQRQNANIVLNANYVNEYENQDKKEYGKFEFISEDKYYRSDVIQRLFPPVVWARLYRTAYIKEHNLIFPNIKGGAEDIFYSAATELPLENVYVYKGAYYHYMQHSMSIMKQSLRGFHYIEAFKTLYEYLCQNDISTDNVKLYCGESLILDTEEKYNYTKNYLNEISIIVDANADIYNDYEKFLYDIIRNTHDYNDFLDKYNPNLSISYVRNKMRKNICKI